MHLLYLCNSDVALHRSDILKNSEIDIFNLKRGEPLVAIGAYALMFNHFHLQIREIRENGISTFMQKLGTAYTMYFNIKNERTGSLFTKPFRSKHINNDEYLRYLTQYIHLNIAEKFEPEWKKGVVKDMKSLEGNIAKYNFSSFTDYHFSINRAEKNILDNEAFDLLGDELPRISTILTEAAAYYEELM